jgi:hypothetical protein
VAAAAAAVQAVAAGILLPLRAKAALAALVGQRIAPEWRAPKVLLVVTMAVVVVVAGALLAVLLLVAPAVLEALR